jgi:hypothetical protein
MPSQSPSRSSVESDAGVILNEIFLFSKKSKLRGDVMSPCPSVVMPKLDAPKQASSTNIGYVGQPSEFLSDLSLKLLPESLYLAGLK